MEYTLDGSKNWFQLHYPFIMNGKNYMFFVYIGRNSINNNSTLYPPTPFSKSGTTEYMLKKADFDCYCDTKGMSTGNHDMRFKRIPADTDNWELRFDRIKSQWAFEFNSITYSFYDETDPLCRKTQELIDIFNKFINSITIEEVRKICFKQIGL